MSFAQVKEIHSGVLHKCGGVVKSWTKRWMILKSDYCLYYYKDPSKGHLGAISLRDTRFKVRAGEKGDCTWPKSARLENTLVIITTGRTYFMYAEDQVEAKRWQDVLMDTHAALLEDARRNNQLLSTSSKVKDGATPGAVSPSGSTKSSPIETRRDLPQDPIYSEAIGEENSQNGHATSAGGVDSNTDLVDNAIYDLASVVESPLTSPVHSMPKSLQPTDQIRPDQEDAGVDIYEQVEALTPRSVKNEPLPPLPFSQTGSVVENLQVLYEDVPGNQLYESISLPTQPLYEDVTVMGIGGKPVSQDVQDSEGGKPELALPPLPPKDSNSPPALPPKGDPKNSPEDSPTPQRSPKTSPAPQRSPKASPTPQRSPRASHTPQRSPRASHTPQSSPKTSPTPQRSSVLQLSHDTSPAIQRHSEGGSVPQHTNNSPHMKHRDTASPGSVEGGADLSSSRASQLSSRPDQQATPDDVQLTSGGHSLVANDSDGEIYDQVEFEEFLTPTKIKADPQAVYDVPPRCYPPLSPQLPRQPEDMVQQPMKSLSEANDDQPSDLSELGTDGSSRITPHTVSPTGQEPVKPVLKPVMPSGQEPVKPVPKPRSKSSPPVPLILKTPPTVRRGGGNHQHSPASSSDTADQEARQENVAGLSETSAEHEHQPVPLSTDTPPTPSQEPLVVANGNNEICEKPESDECLTQTQPVGSSRRNDREGGQPVKTVQSDRKEKGLSLFLKQQEYVSTVTEEDSKFREVARQKLENVSRDPTLSPENKSLFAETLRDMEVERQKANEERFKWERERMKFEEERRKLKMEKQQLREELERTRQQMMTL